jgi:hypothetical protein
MKKYITPNIETIEAIYGSALCNSNDGNGAFEGPGSEPGSQGGPTGAPRRVF